MSPWNVLGWLLVASIAAIALLFVVAVMVSFVKEYRIARHDRRAQAGKVRCEHVEGVECSQIAVRRTPTGYFCEEHYRAEVIGGPVSFAFMLDHAKSDRPNI